MAYTLSHTFHNSLPSKTVCESNQTSCFLHIWIRSPHCILLIHWVHSWGTATLVWKKRYHSIAFLICYSPEQHHLTAVFLSSPKWMLLLCKKKCVNYTNTKHTNVCIYHWGKQAVQRSSEKHQSCGGMECCSQQKQQFILASSAHNQVTQATVIHLFSSGLSKTQWLSC